MVDVNETKKLLGFKASLETRLREIEQEKTDIRTALDELNGMLVNTGFKTFVQTRAGEPGTRGSANGGDFPLSRTRR